MTLKRFDTVLILGLVASGLALGAWSAIAAGALFLFALVQTVKLHLDAVKSSTRGGLGSDRRR